MRLSQFIRMKQYCFFLIFFLGTVQARDCTRTAQAEHNEKTSAPEVILSLGKVRGSLMKTRLNRTIYSFRSMRFAEPPVGDLRFKPAVPVKPWHHTFDASQDLPGCPQSIRSFTPTEDCLRLNVYTTKSILLSSLRPGVFSYTNFNVQDVKIFPEVNLNCRPSKSDFDWPTKVAGRESQRESPMEEFRKISRFLSTGDALAPGNLALKDQVVALQWVQKHIHKFGGDPNLVTLAGCSAGARSVNLHLLSPMSKGLFHHAIVMSGSATDKGPLPHDQKNLAIKQAKLLGCPSDTSENIINCLRNKSAEDIGNSEGKFREWNEDPTVVWSPVVEPDIPGVERFLTAQPVDLIREGKFHHVPVMAGITETELGHQVIPLVSQARNGNNSLFDDLNANWTRIAPISFQYERSTPRSIAISKELRRFYLHNEPAGVHNWEGLCQLYGDGVEGFSVDRLVKLLAAASTKPVWYYEFTYQGRYGINYWPDGKPFKTGHMFDMMYIFTMTVFYPSFEEGAPELGTVEKMTAIWANFAKHGEPIPKNDELFMDVTWPAFTLENNKYLKMGNEFVVKTGLYQDRMNVWEKLFPLSPVSHCPSHKGRS